MGTYYSLPVVVDQDALLDRFYTQMAEAFAGWTPAEGNLETWIARWIVQIASDLGVMAGTVADQIFMRFGQDLVGIPAIEASPAYAPTTWTVADDAGYTIAAGTAVSIARSGDELVAFVVRDDVEIPAGETATADGEVTIVAVLDGEGGNGLTATPQLSDALTFVESITLESATSGGTDPEDPMAYRQRLATELQTLADHPILPDDVAILARKIAGVSRAVAIDGYNPDDDTYDNERMVAVAVVDEAGAAVASPVKDAVAAALEARREINFLFPVVDPDFAALDVDAEVVIYPGFDEDQVTDSVVAAITAYLDPASWGRWPMDRDPATWRRVAVVRQSELVVVANAVAGVDYVPNGGITLALHGDSLATDDLSLDGPAPLTTPGDVTAHT